MLSAPGTQSQWLTLSEASRFLGVHPATLRGWVDAGMIPAFRTPGGHRRFDVHDLQSFLERHKAIMLSRSLAPAEQSLLDGIRRELRTSQVAQQYWYRQLTEEQRARERETGQRMLGLLIQYVSRYENAEHFLDQGRMIAHSYGRDLARAKLSATEVVRAFLFMRRAILNATYQPQDLPALNDAEGMRLYQRINDFMDEMLLSTLDAYERERAES